VTEYNKIFSGYQPRQVVEWRKSHNVLRTEMVLEALVFSPLNHLPRMVAREDIIILNKAFRDFKYSLQRRCSFSALTPCRFVGRY
jgi:hypothetical protein